MGFFVWLFLLTPPLEAEHEFFSLQNLIRFVRSIKKKKISWTKCKRIEVSCHSLYICLQVNSNDLEEANTLALKAAESVKEQRHSRDPELQRRLNARNASDTVSITSSQSLPVTAENGYIANSHGKHSSNASPYGSHGHHPHFGNHIQTSSPLATTSGASPSMQQSLSTPQMQQSMSSSSLQSSSQPHIPSPMSTGSSSGPPCSSSSIPGSATTTPSPRVGSSATDPFKQVDASFSQSSSVDEFTRVSPWLV